MSTYFFTTNIKEPAGANQIKIRLDEIKQNQDIERWNLDINSSGHLLEIETNKLSPEQVKHLLREAGLEAEFTKAPQSR